MAAQATEDMAHPTPPHSEPQSENEQSHERSDVKSERQPLKTKTETEEKIEKETPPLSSDASVSGADGAQHEPNKHVARRSKRTAVAHSGERNNPRQAHQSQGAQQVVPQNQQVQNKGKGGPSVRLDMDLDVDIDLKAKIKGDIELSILGGNQDRR
ncbi:uncharacterized protein ColSpa_03106 [Colletotrichum spaethianum]|uniref:Uncharacterized protein n=1 Tax=Colletotrichum spaethianum TaxID=700344 RepID=A0AA37LBH9_9PEZI|nr:uncharacterized protein ColSpa_03106 [Colletotrichum spaethianum]GKT42925.1 hypothetical protein ColSpa_03106 [Colletotrichum spaethianum]